MDRPRSGAALRRTEVAARVSRAREVGDVDGGAILLGQTAGFIEQIEPAGQIVKRLVREAEEHLVRSAAAVSAPVGRP
jgi:enoyl-[acyl-carrier protein] reductase II